MKELNFFKTVRYSLANSGGLILYSVFNTYIIFFYTDVMHLEPRLVGLIWFVFAFWNAVNDIISGIVSDNILKKVKKRVFIVKYLAIPLSLSFILVWNPLIDLKNSNSIFTVIYIFLTISLFDSFYSSISLNQYSLFPKLFKAGKARIKASSIYSFIGNFSAGLVLVLAPVIYESSLGWLGMSIILAITSLTFLTSSIGVMNNIESKSQDQGVNLKVIYKILRENKKLITLICINISLRFILAIMGSLIPFYAKYVLKTDQNSTSVLTAAVLLSGIGGLFIWQRIFHKIGIINASFISLILGLFAFLPMLFVTSLGLAAVCVTLIGLCIGGVIFLTPDLMYSRLVDQDFKDSGNSREGIFAGIIGFTNRFPPALVGIIFGEVLSLGGFNSELSVSEQPDSISNYIRIFLSVGSIIAIVGCIIFLRRYRTVEKKESSGLSIT